MSQVPRSQKTTCTLRSFLLESPLGPLLVSSCESGIHKLQFSTSDQFSATAIPFSKAHDGQVADLPCVVALLKWLDAYFDKSRSTGDKVTTLTELDRDVTLCSEFTKDYSTFGRKVLHLLKENVPFGKTITYGELAAKCGSPKAYQAVGQILMRNPVTIFIPCHRVVAKTGLGGFCGESNCAVKEWLLSNEGVDLNYLKT